MSKKVVILGAGNVGATIAYTLTIQGIASEIVLIDINKEKAQGEAMDILQGTAFSSSIDLYAGDYADAAGADIVVVTVGRGRVPGETRLDLVQNNVEIIRQVIPPVVKYAPNAVYIVVSNPVDILTYVVTTISGLPQNQVIGSGTMLDSARLRSALAQHVGLSPKNVHAYVLGEHGDTSVIPWSLATIGGMEMSQYCEGVCEEHNGCGKLELAEIENMVRTAGSEVIGRKGSTFYAVSLSVQRLCEAILRNTSSVFTVSTMMTGQYGIHDICLSLPFVIGSEGIKRQIVPVLRPEEEQLLHKSAGALMQVRDLCGLSPIPKAV